MQLDYQDLRFLSCCYAMEQVGFQIELLQMLDLSIRNKNQETPEMLAMALRNDETSSLLYDFRITHANDLLFAPPANTKIKVDIQF